MQNKIIILMLGLAVLSGCMNLDPPYADSLNDLTVTARYPEGYPTRGGARVTVENLTGEVFYSLLTDANGMAQTRLPDGIYRIQISDRDGENVFNGNLDRVHIGGGTARFEVNLLCSKAGTLVIKEIYCGGCPKDPEEGTYQSDQYIILHNNDNIPVALDGLCLGTLSPYNSNSSNPWTGPDGSLPEFLPIIQAVWRIGGDGNSFPLGPGEDAVICLRGAIDHSAQYPLSVNLNKPGYFVCYNNVYFPNPSYHPVPGDQISPDHYLEVVIKTGQANAYTFSINSPAVVIFRADEDIYDFVARPENLIQVPGSSVDRVVAIPLDWVIDGVEVFNGGSSDNHKRLGATIDAGYVIQSETFKGHSLMRLTDDEASALQGFEILQDTNNSTEDFYERDKQSLHK